LLWKDHLRFIGRTLNEANDIERMDDNAVIEHIRLIDEEILREALERKRGVILLSNHFGNPASMLAGLGQRGYPLRVAIKPFRIPSLERRFSDQQESYRAGRIPVGKKLFFVVAETLREKGIFGFTIDYFAGYSRHVSWMQFGNTTMLTNIAPVLFALRTDTPVVYVTTRRHSNGTHTLTFHRDTTVRTGNLNTDAGSITNRGLQLLIDELKVSPAEWWIWDHARLGGEPRATA
jgi:lauroyl/myristoyl acyltransferase